MSYIAWICYSASYDEEDDFEPVIVFEEPPTWKYKQIVPISFSVLHSWTDKDKKLYET